MQVDVLIFGAHPDDIECGVGGIALLLRNQGITFGIVDLTKGEMGSRGTPEERVREAEESAKFLGACFRENLNMGDCALVDTIESRKCIASAIRKYKPRLVLAPFWDDLHNDHIAAGLMVRHSSIYCSISKLESPYSPHKPEIFMYYLLHKYEHPTFVVNISDVFDQKLQALRMYKSQFAKTAEEYNVIPVGIGDYIFHLESRNRYFGSLVNVKFGEALITENPIRLDTLFDLFPGWKS
jgi:bacillithiol biosynthesis deacetylase BshB1